MKHWRFTLILEILLPKSKFGNPPSGSGWRLADFLPSLQPQILTGRVFQNENLIPAASPLPIVQYTMPWQTQWAGPPPRSRQTAWNVVAMHRFARFRNSFEVQAKLCSRVRYCECPRERGFRAPGLDKGYFLNASARVLCCATTKPFNGVSLSKLISARVFGNYDRVFSLLITSQEAARNAPN